MKYIICNTKQRKFFELFASHLDDIFENGFKFVCSTAELQATFFDSSEVHDLIIIETSLNWDDKLLQEFYGVTIAAELRRDFLLNCPIVFFSQLEKKFFEKHSETVRRFTLLNAEGSIFFSYPFSFEKVRNLLLEAKSLNNKALKKVVVNYCDLTAEWEKISHQIGGLMLDYKYYHSEIKILVEKWSRSINQFASEHKEKFAEFRNLVISPFDFENISNIKDAKQNLDDALKGKSSYFSEIPKNNLENLPKFPPKGFSNVLIADDQPLDSLISDLQNEYRYTVVGQAYGAGEAERLLNEKKPDVVLSDYYFKLSSFDATTDKKFGEKFMKLALKTNIGLTNQTKNPMVAVISKTSLDKLDIPPGVLDFSGANATNAEFVHRGIWVEALRRGVSEPEIIAGQKWSLEYRCRQRLEPYESDLPKLVRQWNAFKITVRETLNMIWNIPGKKQAEDLKLLNRIKETLEPFENSNDFSLTEVNKIFAEIRSIHSKAKEEPNTETKTQIRNILHGQVEQFSSVTNHVEFALKVFSEVAADLISLPNFEGFGRKFEKVLTDYNENESLTPFLLLLKKIIDETLKSLPAIPKIDNPFKVKNPITGKIHVLIVEDNKSWRRTINSAVEKVKHRLGSGFQITRKHFNAAARAVAAIPKINATPIKNQLVETTKNIAVVDICLPGKNKKGEIPDPENGVDLIKKLSSYTANIPLIVFSEKAALDDRQLIGRLGVPDENFIAKDFDAESKLIQGLINLIEKKEKFIIEAEPHEKGGTTFYEFLINDLRIPFTKELNITFQALYELREASDLEDELLFTAEEIYQKRLQIKASKNENVLSAKENNPIHDHINRIRELIHKTFQRNNRYVNTRELIKTQVKLVGSDENDGVEEIFTYSLNAESLYTLEDEDLGERDDLKDRSYKILFVGENSNITAQISETLSRTNDTFFQLADSDDLEEKAKLERPDIICTELKRVENWERIRSSQPNDQFGIIIITTNDEENKNRLLERAIKTGIPNTNFVSVNERDWINSFLTKLNNEKQRVFIGEIVDFPGDVNEPIVEILKGSDLKKGVLKLNVDGAFFEMNVSNISKIIGHLLENPKTIISLEVIKKEAVRSSAPVTKDEQTGWAKKIRNKIQKEWLKTKDRDLAMQILYSSSKGMKLNVQVIDLRDAS